MNSIRKKALCLVSQLIALQLGYHDRGHSSLTLLVDMQKIPDWYRNWLYHKPVVNSFTVSFTCLPLSVQIHHIRKSAKKYKASSSLGTDQNRCQVHNTPPAPNITQKLCTHHSSD